DYYAAAFRLDPRDPQIIQSYASMITDREAQAILLRNYLATGGDPSLWALQAGGVGELASPYRSYAIPLAPYYPASPRAAGMLLRVSVNGAKPMRLIFDTGARGIVIGAKAAKNLGLEYLGSSLVHGLGGGEPTRAGVALASSVEIADLRMRNCPVEAAEGLPAGGAGCVTG